MSVCELICALAYRVFSAEHWGMGGVRISLAGYAQACGALLLPGGSGVLPASGVLPDVR